jgi:DNA-binding beta-propeller fold protein YncE
MSTRLSYSAPGLVRAIALRALPLLLAAVPAACSEEVVFDEEDPWQADSDWPGIGSGKILVTNSGDDTLSFLDPATLEPVYLSATGRIPAEREGPHHGASTPDGRYYFVGISNVVPGGGSGPHGSHGTGTVDGYLLRYECESNAPAGEARVSRSPGDVRTTPDGRFVLQSHFDLVSIIEAQSKGEDPRDLQTPLAVVDTETMERIAMIPLCPAAHGLAISGDGATAYVTCWGSDELAVVDIDGTPSDEAEVVRVPIVEGTGGDPVSPTFGPYAATLSPDGAAVWVSNLEGKSLSVYDVETGAMAAPIRLNGSPLFTTFSPDGSVLFVPQQSPDALLAIDTGTGATLSTLNFDSADCRAPHGTLLLDGGDALAVVCEGDHIEPGSVLRVDLTGEAPALDEVFQVGVYPDDLVYIPEAQ